MRRAGLASAPIITIDEYGKATPPEDVYFVAMDSGTPVGRVRTEL